jgi:hypothetical protein
MKKIVALSAPFPGAKRPLEEGAKLGWWDFINLGDQPHHIPRADTYIFGAWHPDYEPLIRMIKDQMGYQTKICVLWTSSIGEVDLCPPETGYLSWIMESPLIDKVWFGDPGFHEAYPKKSFFAYYPLAVNVGMAEIPIPEKHQIVTLFCPSTTKKNILVQLMAVKIAQRLATPEEFFTLHTNVDGYGWILKDIRHHQHPWLEKAEYEALIGSSKCNLALSHCETFNYQVAEAALLGTPSLISNTIPLMGYLVEDHTNVLRVVEGIQEMLHEDTGYAIRNRGALIHQALGRNKQTELTLAQNFYLAG